MEFKIEKEWDQRTVKEFLYGKVGVSRAVLTRLKQNERGILLCGKRVTVRAVLKENDILSLELSDTADGRVSMIPPRDLPLSVVYEDDFLLVVNKAPGMPTHPTRGHYEDTLANALAAYQTKNNEKGGVFRAVNRLDRDTSGLVLIAKDQLSAAKLGRSLQEGRIEKTYLALLSGCVAEPEGKIEVPICRVSESIITRRCCEKGQGDDALTLYRVLCRYRDYTLVQARPITGRTHQLRVHFAHIGHPILGDTLYGKEDCRMARQALHANSLSFPHPTDDKTLRVTCPVPADMLELIKEGNYEITQLDPK
ncbi:MAG: RluA family pseudouridine synthase [Ruminococcaceae bacterium]|nr:RluA family pseudouridine synthase [Oscillospiraceae bacterium]